MSTCCIGNHSLRAVTDDVMSDALDRPVIVFQYTYMILSAMLALLVHYWVPGDCEILMSLYRHLACAPQRPAALGGPSQGFPEYFSILFAVDNSEVVVSCCFRYVRAYLCCIYPSDTCLEGNLLYLLCPYASVSYMSVLLPRVV